MVEPFEVRSAIAELSSRVPAVSRAVAVLEDLAITGPASLTVLARRLGLPKSSLLGICSTLVDERLLAQDSRGRYVLGLGLAELAAAQVQHPARLSRLGVTVPNASNPFYAVEVDAIRTAAADLGAEVLAREAAQDVATQTAQIANFIAERVDAIVIDAVHSTEIAGAIATARSAGVTVVAVNVGAEGADATVTTDNEQAGRLVGQHLAGLLGGVGAVAIVDGLPVTATADRVAGFLAALRDYPQIQVVARQRGDHSFDEGKRIAEDILAHHPDLSGFFGINDPTADGIAAALASASMELPVVSVDGAASAAAAIAEGGPLKATAAQDPAQLGRLAVRLATQLHSGERPARRVLLLPTILVTEANVATYDPWG